MNFDFEFYLLHCEYMHDRAFGVFDAELYGHPRHTWGHQWSKLLHASTRLAQKSSGRNIGLPPTKG